MGGFGLFSQNPCPGSTTVTDVDGNVYNTVQIGNQCWMKENLRVTHYPNNSAIPIVNNVSAWDNIGLNDHAYCYCNDEVSNSITYGALYTWATIMNGASSSNNVPSNVQGICPNGWHIPSDEEWKILEGTVDSNYGYPDQEWNGYSYRGHNAGYNLKSNNGWNDNGNGSNLFGFSALPGSYRDPHGNFQLYGVHGQWWSATEHSQTVTYCRGLNSDYDGIYRSTYSKKVSGHSVRCIKDNSILTGMITDSQTNSPIDNASISISNAQNTYTTYTNSDGSYEIYVEPGYGYNLQVNIAGYDPYSEADLNVGIGSQTHDIQLTAQVTYSDYRIVPVELAPNPDTIRVPEGGYAYAWFVVEGDWNNNWLPIPNVEVTAQDEQGNQIGTQSNKLFFQFLTAPYHFQNLGVFGMKVASSSIGSGNPGDYETIKIVSADGNPILQANQDSFIVKVEPFTYTADWGYRLFVEAGVGVSMPGVFSAGGFAGGGSGSSMRIELSGISNNPSWSTFEVHKKGDIYAGLEASVGSPPSIGVSANANVEITASVPYQQEYEFDMNDLQGLEALIAFYMFYEPAVALTQVPQLAVSFLNWSVEAIISNSNNNGLGISHIADQTGLDIEGSVSTSIDVGVGVTNSIGLGASASLGANAHIGTSLRATTDNMKQTSIYVGGGFNQSTGIGPAILGAGNDAGKLYPARFGASPFPNSFDVEFSGTSYFDNNSWEKIRLDASLDLGTSLFNINIPDPSPVSLSLAIEDHQIHNAWLEIDNQDVKNILNNSFGLMSNLDNIGASVANIAISNNSFKEGLSNFMSDVYTQQNNSSPVILDYGFDLNNKTTYDFEVEFDFPIPPFPMLNFSIGGGINAYESQEFTMGKGYWVKGLPYLQHEIEDIPAPNLSFFSIMQQLWNEVKSGNVLSELQSVITSHIGNKYFKWWPFKNSTNQQHSLNNTGSYIIINSQSIPAGIDSVYCNHWTWGEENVSKSMASSKQKMVKKYIQNIKSLQQQIDGLEYGIGGFYQFGPDSLMFGDSTMITIAYDDTSVAGIDETELAVYWEDSLGYWNYIPSFPEPDSNRVSAYITQFATYTLAPKLPQGEYNLHFEPDSLPADGDSIATIYSDSIFYSDGSLVEDGLLFTVWSTRGNIITPDADTTILGVQVVLDSCRVEFEVKADSIPTPIGITMSSVKGYAAADTSIILFDETIPGIPTLVSASGENKTVVLSWSMVGDPDLAGYKVYFGTDSIPPFNGFATVFAEENPVLTGITSSHSCSGLFNDSLYYFAITSFDISGNESDYSNILSSTPFLDTTNYGSQAIPLPAEWSLFSTYVEPIEPNIDSVSEQILPNAVIMKNWAGQVYWPQFSINLIGDLIAGQGYQVKMINPDTLIVEGIIVQPENVEIPIPMDWYILGYLRTTPAPIQEMLSPLLGNLVIVKSGTGQIYWPQYNINHIMNMVPGQGYQTNMTSADTLIYPSNDSTYSKVAFHFSEPVYYKINVSSDNNMTLGIPLSSWDKKPEKGDEIGVFDSSGNLVGSTVFNDEHIAITIWGDDRMTNLKEGLFKEELFTIKHWSVETETESDIVVDSWLAGNNKYLVNKISIVENLDVHSNISFGNTILYQNIPNPFTNETEFSFYLPEACEVTFEIFNLVGEKVGLVSEGHFEKGKHTIIYHSGSLPAGSYYYRLQTPDGSQTKKMTILR